MSNNAIKPVPFIIVSIVFVILCTLGSWQMYRLNWKNNLIKEIGQKISAAPIDLPYDWSKFADLIYNQVIIKGSFINDKEIHLYAGSRVYKGEPGYLILTPFKRDDGSYILVNRGWVSEKVKTQNKRPGSLIERETEVTGFLMEDEERTWITPDNDIDKNLWLWIDMDAIKQTTGFDMPYYVVMKKMHDKNEIPLGKDIITANIRNDHFAYAFIWFGSAISLAVIYVLTLRKMKDLA
jgi:surfeit locus 1 family protein